MNNQTNTLQTCYRLIACLSSSLNSIKTPLCFPESITSPLLLSTGLFQEQVLREVISADFLLPQQNCNKLHKVYNQLTQRKKQLVRGSLYSAPVLMQMFVLYKAYSSVLYFSYSQQLIKFGSFVMYYQPTFYLLQHDNCKTVFVSVYISPCSYSVSVTCILIYLLVCIILFFMFVQVSEVIVFLFHKFLCFKKVVV